MKLKDLKYSGCPTCLARVETETQRSQHTNGHWFESVTFKCGCRIEYLPNYCREEVVTQCPKHHKEVAKKAKQDEAMRKLRRYISRMDVDEDYKEQLTRYWL